MSSTVSKVCKISSIIVGILCFIGGIVIGNVFGGRGFRLCFHDHRMGQQLLVLSVPVCHWRAH